MTLFSSPGLKKTGSFCLFPSWTSHLEPSCHTVRKVRASLMAQPVKNLSAMQETQVLSLGQEDPLEKEMTTHSSILVWKSYGQRNLVGYSPKACKESDMTEQLNTQAWGEKQPVGGSTGKDKAHKLPPGSQHQYQLNEIIFDLPTISVA